MDQSDLLPNKIPGLYEHQYLWKEIVDFLDFCMEMFTKKR